MTRLSPGPDQPASQVFEEAGPLLTKIKDTAQHVPVCHAQIDLLYDRSSMLLEAFLIDSVNMDAAVLTQASDTIRTLYQRIHAKLLQFAIYGRPKAVVLRGEITGYLEGFNVQLDDCLFAFQTSDHQDIYEWRHDFEAAKEADEDELRNTIYDLIKDEASVKQITVMGQTAVDSLCEILELTLLNGYMDPIRTGACRRCLQRLRLRHSQVIVDAPPSYAV